MGNNEIKSAAELRRQKSSVYHMAYEGDGSDRFAGSLFNILVACTTLVMRQEKRHFALSGDVCCLRKEFSSTGLPSSQ